MSRGGRRKGSGAKPGNINALKTGQHSKFVRDTLDNMADPETGIVILTKKGGVKLVRRKRPGA